MLWGGTNPRKYSREKRIRANPADAKASISPNTQVTFTDERVTSFLMLSKIQSSQLEQIHEGTFFASLGFQCEPLNMNDAPAYPRLM